MLSLDELSKEVKAYQAERIDLDAFEQWFRDNSWGSYDRPGEALSDVIVGVEVALSDYHRKEIDEHELREELADAVRPLVISQIKACYSQIPNRPGSVDIQKVQSEAIGTVVEKNPSPKFARSTSQQFRLHEVTA